MMCEHRPRGCGNVWNPTVVFRLFIATRLASTHYGKSYKFSGKIAENFLDNPVFG